MSLRILKWVNLMIISNMLEYRRKMNDWREECVSEFILIFWASRRMVKCAWKQFQKSWEKPKVKTKLLRMYWNLKWFFYFLLSPFHHLVKIPRQHLQNVSGLEYVMWIINIMISNNIKFIMNVNEWVIHTTWVNRRTS